MNKYNDYRQIDLPWLKDIPSHWGIRRNKNIFTEMKNEVGEDSDKYTLLSLSKKGIIPRDVESGKGKFPEKFDKYKIVKPGYMAFCLFDIDETPRTVGLSELDGMLTGAYTIMDVHDVNPRYAFYYYLALDNVKALMDLGVGGSDAVAMDTVVARYYMAKDPGKYSIIKDTTILDEKMGVGFRKGDNALCKKVEDTLKEMKKDGTLAKISKEWFGEDLTIIGEDK